MRNAIRLALVAVPLGLLLVVVLRWALGPADSHTAVSAVAGAHEDTSRALDLSPVQRPAREGGTNVKETAPPVSEPPSTGDERVPEAEPALAALVVSNGVPVGGARLSVFRRPLASPVSSHETDASGRCAVADPRAGDEWAVDADGLPEARLVLGDPPWVEPVVVELAPGTTLLTGKVLDELGAPVAGTELTMSVQEADFRARTDAEGGFRLAGPAGSSRPQEASFSILASGYCDLFEGVVLPIPERDPVVLRVAHWAWLTVRAVDSAEREVAVELRLSVSPDADEQEWFPGGGLRVMMLGSSTGSGGPRRIAVPPVVPLWLRASHPDLGQLDTPLDALSPGEEREVTVRFAGTAAVGPLRFRLVDGGGQPVRAAYVAVRWTAGTEGRTSYLQSDEEGIVPVERPAHDWELAVLAAGFEEVRRSFEAGYWHDGVVDVVLVQSDVGIRVLVQDADGRPSEGVRLHVMEEGEARLDRSGRTDARGRAEFLGLDATATYRVNVGFGQPGDYSADADDAGWAPSPAAYRGVRPIGGELVFRLVRSASVGGALRGPGAEGGRVHLSCLESPDAALPPLFSVGSALGRDGAFLFTGLPPGHYRLWAQGTEPESSPEHPLATLDVHEGEEVRDLLVTPR
jgi:hypothetical protein